jgi:hypothetical protein
MKLKADFFIASSEGYGMSEPRACYSLRRLRTESRDDLLLIRIEPPLIGQQYGMGGRDVDTVFVAPRHKGTSLFPPHHWPIYVHVGRLLGSPDNPPDPLHRTDYEEIAWAELYETEATAHAAMRGREER